MSNNPLLDERERLKGSLLLFSKVFYQLMTGREFRISEPVSHEPHIFTFCKALMKVFKGQTQRLMINCPPGWHKSTMCQMFVAWSMAHYADSQILYVSYSHDRAMENTFKIRQIMEMKHYRDLFQLYLSDDVRAKDHFKTMRGGAVQAFGSAGGITGADAGLPHVDRFSGCLLIDDIHKADDVHSDTKRETVIDTYHRTLLMRPRSPKIPIIFIGQRLHEDDLPGRLLAGGDGHTWETVILRALDEHDNAIYPEVHTREEMILKRKIDPYVFASQFNQDPIPAGGGLFKPDWFHLMENDPEILATFICVDTAETTKTINDATVFSFFGVYKIKDREDMPRDEWALHWIDCHEIRVEPKDLKPEFLAFYARCCQYKVRPQFAAIEKKSTGTTLLSILQNEMRGIEIREIERNPYKDGRINNKTNRYLAIQPFVAKKLVSLTADARHSKMCVEHMKKITANDTHRHDDIADTLADGVMFALINKSFTYHIEANNQGDVAVKKIINFQSHINKLKERASWHTR